MSSLDTSSPQAYAKAFIAEFTTRADAAAGDLTAASTWGDADFATLSDDFTEDECRSFKQAVAVAMDNFHKTYVYTP